MCPPPSLFQIDNYSSLMIASLCMLRIPMQHTRIFHICPNHNTKKLIIITQWHGEIKHYFHILIRQSQGLRTYLLVSIRNLVRKLMQLKWTNQALSHDSFSPHTTSMLLFSCLLICRNDNKDHRPRWWKHRTSKSLMRVWQLPHSWIVSHSLLMFVSRVLI